MILCGMVFVSAVNVEVVVFMTVANSCRHASHTTIIYFGFVEALLLEKESLEARIKEPAVWAVRLVPRGFILLYLEAVVNSLS